MLDLVAAPQKSPQKKQEQMQGALQRLVAAIKRDTASARKYGTIAVKTAAMVASGKNVVDRLNDLRECRR